MYTRETLGVRRAANISGSGAVSDLACMASSVNGTAYDGCPGLSNLNGGVACTNHGGYYNTSQLNARPYIL